LASGYPSDKSTDRRKIREAARACHALLKKTEELLDKAKRVGGPESRDRRGVARLLRF
jgi:hypothetical protein